MNSAAATAIALRPSRAAHAQTANLLSASRFVFAALWLSAFLLGDMRPVVTIPIALAAALSDFVDGRIARWSGSAGAFGQWLDSLADIAFVLTAITCETRAGAIPAYLPALIAISFTQYAIDSVVLRGSPVPVKSRLGHWGGIINYALVMGLAFAPPPRRLGTLVRQASPVLAIFYAAAIVERALAYPHRWPGWSPARRSSSDRL